MSKKMTDTEKLTNEELAYRRQLAHKMDDIVQAEADTDNWHYECRVSPVYLDSREEWRITVEGMERNKAEENTHTRYEAFDLHIIRAYHKIFGEIIEKFDKGEIKKPW